MQSDRDRELRTLDEAAAMLGISKHTLERWARAGRIPSSISEDGVRMFDRNDLVDRSVGLDDLDQQE